MTLKNILADDEIFTLDIPKTVNLLLINKKLNVLLLNN